MIFPWEPEALTFIGIFCRTGACLGLSPGFGSPRIPVRIRLFVCLALCINLTSFVAGPSRSTPIDLQAILAMVIPETIAGLALGLGARVFMAALEAMSTTMSLAIGLSSSFSPRIEESETLPDLASLLALTATLLIFASDLHWSFIQGVVDSYALIPMGVFPNPEATLLNLTDRLAQAFLLELRIAMPFVAFGLFLNVATAIVNRMTPQIPLYFLSTPLSIAGGLYLLYLLLGDATVFLTSIGGYF